MRKDNVVPFEPALRGGMARRGALDKNVVVRDGNVTLACPSCGCEYELEPAWLEGLAEVLCGGCDTEIDLAGYVKPKQIRAR